MTSEIIPANFGDRQSAVGSHVQTWPHIIWREWRNTEDVAYARQLFDLVVDKPTDRWATTILALIGAIVGAIGGWLIMLLLYPGGFNFDLITWGTTIGIIVGTGSSLLVMLGLRLSGRAQWGIWLQGLTPDRFMDEVGGLVLDSPYFRVVVALGSGLGVGMTGALFFGQSNPQFYILLGLLVILLIYSFWTRRWSGLTGGLGGIAGWLFGLFFGLGLAQLVGLFITPLNVANSARVVGMAVGAGVGLFWGRRAGLIGVLISQMVVTGLVIAAGFNLVLLGWLVGLLIGGAATAIGRMYQSGETLNSYDAYNYRELYLWWFWRPPAAAIETALRQHGGEVWQPHLHRLDANRKRLSKIETLVSGLEHEDWLDRFLARHTLVAYGGEAIPALLDLVRLKPRQFQRTVAWLIRSIGHETTQRLAEAATQMLCLHCLTCCGTHTINPPGFPVRYYGCRTCGQSRELLYCPQGVVAVLDSGWTEPRPQQGGFLQKIFSAFATGMPQMVKQAQNRGLLRVNWLAYRQLFDFDRVEIIRATDEDVERFAVQVGNDTDPLRTARYPQMQCRIAPEYRLSENSLRILRSTFGHVEQGQERAA